MWRLTLLNWKREHKCYTKPANINVQKLTSLNLVLRTTKMPPVKPQISKFKAEKSCQVGFNVLRRLYSWAFVKRLKSFVHVSISFVCNILSVEIAQGVFALNLKRGWYVLNVDNTVAIAIQIQTDNTLVDRVAPSLPVMPAFPLSSKFSCSAWLLSFGLCFVYE